MELNDHLHVLFYAYKHIIQFDTGKIFKQTSLHDTVATKRKHFIGNILQFLPMTNGHGMEISRCENEN